MTSIASATSGSSAYDRGHRAVVLLLLLNRRDRDDVDRRVPGLGDPPGRLERDVGAEPVVESARGDAAVAELDGLAPPDAGIADRDPGRGILEADGADVDVQLLAAGDDAFDRPLAAGDHDALAVQHLLVERADRGEGEQAVGVDVRHCDPDLVDVAEDRERRGAARRDPREGVAESVAVHVGEPRGSLAPDARLPAPRGRTGRPR